MADRVAVMYAGRIVEQGSATAVFGAPTHPYTRGLLDCIPRAGQTAARGPLGSIPGIVPSLVGDVSGCGFRNRCAHAREACRTGEIAFAFAGEAHDYRCILPPNMLRAREPALTGDAP